MFWRKQDKRGTESLEFAATAPILFLLLIAIVQFGWGVFEQQAVQEAARHGVRMGVVAQANSAGVAQAAALQYAQNAGVRNPRVEVLAPGGRPGSVLTVRVTGDVPDLLEFIGVGNLHVTAQATGRQEGW